MNADLLVLAAHPDDAEIGCGGTILKLCDAGRRVVVADMTRGEKATRGTPELREKECAAATRLLGIADRVNLGLPDTALADDATALRAVVAVIRRVRPQIMLAPMPADAHPDHEATCRVARRAFFHSGLRNVLPELGAVHRPRFLLFYFSNDFARPTFCVDIASVFERKRAVIECYATQVAPVEPGKSHFVRGLDPLERCLARDRYFGSICGLEAAEPFVSDDPLPLDGLGVFLKGVGS